MTQEHSEGPTRSPGDLLAEGPSRIEEAADPNTESLSDIGRQISFYRELLSLEREVLEQMRALAEHRDEELRQAVQRSNIEPMQALIEQFDERLKFWEQRERELNRD